uniref:Uncharacterized protein n=1 Tax=Aquila chrysaetos chrysaetos TaxID=223781 RepID=A0A663F8E6_AQUCH
MATIQLLPAHPLGEIFYYSLTQILYFCTASWPLLARQPMPPLLPAAVQLILWTDKLPGSVVIALFHPAPRAGRGAEDVLWVCISVLLKAGSNPAFLFPALPREALE